MRRLLLLVGVALPLALFFRTYVAEAIYIATPSMEPTLMTGRRLFVNKLLYRFRPPRRGEIVVFPSPVDAEKELVKRVIAIGGDTIEIRRKEVFVNGTLLLEPYTQHTRENEMLVGDNIGPLEVPKGKLFVMGDNRDESGDSRDWKGEDGQKFWYISESRLKGRVIDFP